MKKSELVNKLNKVFDKKHIHIGDEEREKEKIIKLEDIHTMACFDGELILNGTGYSTNWYEKNIQIRINTHEVLEWINIQYIKEKHLEYINKIVD